MVEILIRKKTISFSPFKKSKSKINKNIDIVIFLPDFVDAPFSGGKFVFADITIDY